MILHSHIGNFNSVGATIGITYDNDVAQWDVPGTEWYVPKPADISCDAVESYMALLRDYIGQWQKRLYDATHTLIRNNNKIHNAQFMVNALNQRLGEYQARKDVCDNPPPPPPPVEDVPPVEDPTGGNNSGSGSGGSSLLWIGLAAAGVFVISKLKKRKKERRYQK